MARARDRGDPHGVLALGRSRVSRASLRDADVVGPLLRVGLRTRGRAAALDGRGRLVFERRPAGLAIFLFALVVQPLIGLLLGRTWRQVEIFGVAPDPTAIATLGLLLLATGRVRWEQLVVPLFWCAISG